MAAMTVASSEGKLKIHISSYFFCLSPFFFYFYIPKSDWRAGGSADRSMWLLAAWWWCNCSCGFQLATTRKNARANISEVPMLNVNVASSSGFDKLRGIWGQATGSCEHCEYTIKIKQTCDIRAQLHQQNSQVEYLSDFFIFILRGENYLKIKTFHLRLSIFFGAFNQYCIKMQKCEQEFGKSYDFMSWI